MLNILQGIGSLILHPVRTFRGLRELYRWSKSGG